MPNPSGYATLREAAAYMRVSYKYVKEHLIEFKEKYGVRVSKVANRFIVPYADLDAMISQREVF